MVTLTDLKQALGSDRDWVVLGPGGELLELDVPGDVGPAALFVARVSDALKSVSDDGLVVGAPRRDQVWEIEAFVLNRIVVEALDPVADELSLPEGLLTMVEKLGFGWQVKPIPPA